MSTTNYPNKYIAEINTALQTHFVADLFRMSASRFNELPTYLEQLIDACFFASLYQEESKKVCFALAFSDWNKAQSAGSCDSLIFDTPLRLEPKSLAKLALSADPRYTYIMVDTASDNSLIIRGLFYDQASKKTESESVGFGPILLRVLGAGVLELEVLLHVIFRYDKGRMYIVPFSLFKIQALAPLTNPLMDPRHVLGIARHILHLGHGGTLFVVPEDIGATMDAQSMGLELRYGCRGRPFGTLRKKKATEPKSPPFYNIDFEREYAEIANLTTVDGAVLMSSGLDILAYGVFVGALGGSVELSEKGSRHKSAIGFCERWIDSLAVVVSQDGDVTLFTRKNGATVQIHERLLM